MEQSKCLSSSAGEEEGISPRQRRQNFKIKIPLKQNKWFLKSAKTVYGISLFYKKKYCENGNKFHQCHLGKRIINIYLK